MSIVLPGDMEYHEWIADSGNGKTRASYPEWLFVNGWACSILPQALYSMFNAQYPHLNYFQWFEMYSGKPWSLWKYSWAIQQAFQLLQQTIPSPVCQQTIQLPVVSQQLPADFFEPKLNIPSHPVKRQLLSLRSYNYDLDRKIEVSCLKEIEVLREEIKSKVMMIESAMIPIESSIELEKVNAEALDVNAEEKEAVDADALKTPSIPETPSVPAAQVRTFADQKRKEEAEKLARKKEKEEALREEERALEASIQEARRLEKQFEMEEKQRKVELERLEAARRDDERIEREKLEAAALLRERLLQEKEIEAEKKRQQEILEKKRAFQLEEEERARAKMLKEEKRKEKMKAEMEEKLALEQALAAKQAHDNEILKKLAEEAQILKCLDVISDCRYYLPCFGQYRFDGDTNLLAHHILIMEDIGLGIFRSYSNWAVTQNIPDYSAFKVCFQKDSCFTGTSPVPPIFENDSVKTFSLAILAKVIIDVGICCFRIRALIEPDFVDETKTPGSNILHNLNYNFGAIYKKCMLKSYTFQLLQAYTSLQHPLLMDLLDRVKTFENFVETTLFPSFRSCFPLPILPMCSFDWNSDIHGNSRVNDACITSWLTATPMPTCVPPVSPKRKHFEQCEIPVKNFMFKSGLALKELRERLRSCTPFLDDKSVVLVTPSDLSSFNNHSFATRDIFSLATTISDHLRKTLDLITESSQMLAPKAKVEGCVIVKFDHAFTTLLFDKSYLLAFLSSFPPALSLPCKFSGPSLFKVSSSALLLTAHFTILTLSLPIAVMGLSMQTF